MSDTPRIDAAEIRIKSAGPCLVKDVCTIDTARRIERELNAANARIRRLEEAGDAMEPFCVELTMVILWKQAKEAKP